MRQRERRTVRETESKGGEDEGERQGDTLDCSLSRVNYGVSAAKAIASERERRHQERHQQTEREGNERGAPRDRE